MVDQNTQAQSYTCLEIKKPYIALNTETYITIRQQELRTCKRIGYEFYCEELFVVKHKSKYSCKSMIHFNLSSETIKENCRFNFYYKKTDITHIVLDGGNELSWQIGQMINSLCATLMMTYQSRCPAIHMC